jgi:hypothetical protein
MQKETQGAFRAKRSADTMPKSLLPSESQPQAGIQFRMRDMTIEATKEAQEHSRLKRDCQGMTTLSAQG